MDIMKESIVERKQKIYFYFITSCFFGKDQKMLTFFTFIATFERLKSNR